MVTANDIIDAADRLRGVTNLTPLLEFGALNRLCGGRILLKAETLQETGSFKMRGAYNRIAQLNAEERKSGVVAWSSGNHAQGVARAAQIVGAPAVIVMPEDAPQVKVAGTRALGAEIVFYDRYNDDREAIGYRIAEERGMVVVPAFDDPHVIAGQGTVGLEAAAQAKALGTEIDQFLVCAGGGGLTAGCGIALRHASPTTAIYTVEPEGYDDIALSLAAGEPVRVDTTRKSIADALLPPTPGHLTWPILRDHVTKGLVVSDNEIRMAVRYAFHALRLKVEPGGAAALAAVLAGKLDLDGRVTGLTLSGGNVDPDVLQMILSDGTA